MISSETQTGLPSSDDDVSRRITEYLERIDLSPESTTVERLHGDASSRCYARIRPEGHRSFVLAIHATPFHPEQLVQLTVAKIFEQRGIPVPQVTHHAGDLGILALDDLGDDTLQQWLTVPSHNPVPLYQQAIDYLARLQLHSGHQPADGPPFTLAFDTEKLSWELEFFQSEFLGAYRQRRIPPTEEEALRQELAPIVAELAAEPRVLCHRDYHSRNLMVQPGRLVVIDFQDARMGPNTYDLVSLLRDCYVDTTPVFVDAMIAYFLRVAPEAQSADYRRRFDLMSVQRHLKALGTFGHQISRLHRNEFAAPIPRTLRYLRETLHAYPRFARLLEILTPHLPEIA